MNFTDKHRFYGDIFNKPTSFSLFVKATTIGYLQGRVLVALKYGEQ